MVVGSCRIFYLKYSFWQYSNGPVEIIYRCSEKSRWNGSLANGGRLGRGRKVSTSRSLVLAAVFIMDGA